MQTVRLRSSSFIIGYIHLSWIIWQKCLIKAEGRFIHLYNQYPSYPFQFLSFDSFYWKTELIQRLDLTKRTISSAHLLPIEYHLT